MNSRLLISLLCAGAVALACGSLSRSDASFVPTDRRGEHARGTSKDTLALVGGVFRVQVEPSALRFALDVTNRGEKSVELAFPNGQEFDFAVTDSAGRELYRWGAKRMFTQSLRNETIGGGDTMRIDERAPMTLPRGTYYAVATLKSSNHPLLQKTAFQLR